MSSLKRAAVAGATWTASAAFLAIAFRAATLGVLTRHLERRDFGLIGMVVAILGIMQTFGDLGLQNAIISKHEENRDRLSSLFWSSVLAGAAVTALAFAARPLVQRFYGEPRLGDLLAWLSVRFILTGLSLPYQAMLQRDLQFRTLGILQIGAGLAGAAVSIGMAFSGYGIWSLIAGELAQSGAFAVLSFAAGARSFVPRLRLVFDDLRGYISFGGAQVGERAASIYAMNVDYIVIGRVLGPEALGLYSVAFEVASFPNRAFNPILMRVTLPVFAKKQTDDAAFARGYTELSKVLAFAQFPLSVGVLVFAPQIMGVFFGSSWVAAAPLLRVLAILGGIRMLCNPAGSAFAAKGRPDVGLIWAVSASIVNTVVFWIVVPYGLIAMAWAWIALATVYLIALTRLLGWLVKLDAAAYTRALLRPLVVNIAIWALLELMWRGVSGTVPDAAALAVVLTAAGLTYATAAYFSDRQFVGRTIELIRDAMAR